MSGSYKDMLKRAELHQLANFASCGVESNAEPIKDFDLEENIAYEKLNSELQKYLDDDVIYKIIPIINTYSAQIGDLNFIMGMKYVAKLMFELQK